MPKTKDFWYRDYMPVQVAKDLFVRFNFDPTYGQPVICNFRMVEAGTDNYAHFITFPTVGQKK